MPNPCGPRSPLGSKIHRAALQELSHNVQRLSPDVSHNLDFISFENEGNQTLPLELDISFASKGEPRSELDCSCMDSSALEHSEYRRRAKKQGKDSRVFDDEYADITEDNPTVGHELKPHKQKTNVGPWKLGKTLGTGASGRVRLVRHIETGKLGAVKIMTKHLVQEQNVDVEDGKSKQRWTNSMEREVIIMKIVRHPNIVQMLDVWEGRHELFLILEYVEGGDLFDYMVKRGYLSEAEAVPIFAQILKGIEYCHQFNICHRDLKLENILLDGNNQVKIADFGFAALQLPGWKLIRSCGTPHYAAPEVISGKEYNGPPADIWSCGIILFALLNGFVPFDDEDHFVVLNKVRSGLFAMPPHMSREAKDLIHQMLTLDPDLRITMQEIWRHPLITLYVSSRDIASRKQLLTVEGPAIHPEEIDDAILESMRNLWPRATDVQVVKAAVLDALPNQEKVFYALLEQYKHIHSEYFSGKLVSHTESFRRSVIDTKDESNLRRRSINRSSVNSTTSTRSARSTRSNIHNGTSIVLDGNETSKTSTQPLKQIQEVEEGVETGESQDYLQESSKDSDATLFQVDEDDEDNWQDYEVCGNEEADNDTETTLADSHVFLDEESLRKEILEYESDQKSKITDCETSYIDKRKSKAISYISVASHKRLPRFKTRSKTRQNIINLQETFHEEGSSFYMAPVGGLTEFKILSRKEGQARRNLIRSSIGSNYSGTMLHMATAVPVRRRGCFFVPAQPEDEDVRKASRDLGDYCERAFNTRHSIYTKLPYRLPSSAILDETISALENTTIHEEGPEIYEDKDGDENENKHIVQDNVKSGLKDDAKDDIENRVYYTQTREETDKRPLPRSTKSNRRHVPKMTSVNFRKQRRRSALAPIRSQRLNARKMEAYNNQGETSLIVPASRSLSVKKGSGFTDLPVIVSQSPAMDKREFSGSSRARSDSTSRASVVEYYRTQAVKIGSGTFKVENIEISQKDVPVNNLPPPKKRGLFNKLGEKLGGKCFNNKTEPAQAKVQQSDKGKTLGFWSMLGVKFSSKSAQERGSAAENPLSWDGECRHSHDTSASPPLDWQQLDEAHENGKPVQYKKPEWFKRALKIKQACHIMCFRTDAATIHQKFLDVLGEWSWKKLGLVDVRFNRRQGVITARVSKRNAINIRPVSFMIQVRSYGSKVSDGQSVVRILQQKGAASSLRRLVHEIEKIFKRQGILIDDPVETLCMEGVFDLPVSMEMLPERHIQ